MPNLDVTKVLQDLNLVDDSLICTRRTQTVGPDGRAVDTSNVVRFSGVVVPDSGNILERLAAGSVIKGTINVHTTFELRDGAAGGDADLVTWQGRKYTVTDVNDWSRWGAGFVSARCELQDLNLT